MLGTGLLILDSGRLLHVAGLPASGPATVLSERASFVWVAPTDVPAALEPLAQSLWVVERRSIKVGGSGFASASSWATGRLL